LGFGRYFLHGARYCCATQKLIELELALDGLAVLLDHG
jgi:hypothetical protein